MAEKREPKLADQFWPNPPNFFPSKIRSNKAFSASSVSYSYCNPELQKSILVFSKIAENCYTPLRHPTLNISVPHCDIISWDVREILKQRYLCFKLFGLRIDSIFRKCNLFLNEKQRKYDIFVPGIFNLSKQRSERDLYLFKLFGL